MVTVNANNNAPDGRGLISSLNLVSKSNMFLPDNAAFDCVQWPKSAADGSRMFFLDTAGVGKARGVRPWADFAARAGHPAGLGGPIDFGDDATER